MMLMLLIASASIAASLITPAFSIINQAFPNGPHHELCMSLYLLGYLAGILFYAPLIKKIGRARAIRLGLFLAVASSLFNLWSYESQQSNITPFIISRFFIGFGLAAGLVCGMSHARSTFKDTSLRRFLSQLAIFFKISIYSSVLLGGYLATYSSLTSILFGTVLLSTALLLHQLKAKLNVKQQLADNLPYKLRTNYFSYDLFKSSIAVSISTVIAYSYATFAPIIAIDILQLSPFLFSVINILNMSGVIIGAVFYHKFLPNISDETTIFTSILVGLVFTWAIAILGTRPTSTPTTAMFFIIGGAMNCIAGVIYPSGSFLCLNATPDIESSSSMMNFFKIGMPALIIFFIRGISGNNYEKLSITIAIPCLLYLLLKSVEHLYYRYLRFTSK